MKILSKICFTTLLVATIFMAGCAKKNVLGPDVTSDTVKPTVSTHFPSNAATGVATNADVTATFSEQMNASTITAVTFNVKNGATTVPCVITYVGNVATLNPIAPFALNSTYSVTVTTGAKDLAGNGLAVNKSWSFTTGVAMPIGPATVNLGTAANYVILSKAGITTVPTSVVTGDIGVSPIDSTAITGFPLSMDSGNTFATTGQVTGRVYAADFVSPTPANMTVAISDMETAYVDAAGRATPDFVELGAGDISGLTIVPGLYKWGTGVLVSTDVTLNGGPNDIWIFQISGGDLTLASGAKILLSGGAKAKNIFWVTFGAVALNTTAHLEGNVLCYTGITLATGASINGRLLAQTAVTIDGSTVSKPAP